MKSNNKTSTYKINGEETEKIVVKNKNVSDARVRIGLIIGFVSMVVASGILIMLAIKFFNGNDTSEIPNNNLEVSLEKNNFVCKNQEVCDGLDNNIVSIKNLYVSCGDVSSVAIILDKNGNVYFKLVDDVIKLKGKTKLKDILYAVLVDDEKSDIIIYDNSGIYYVDGEEYTIRDYELSSDIKYFVSSNGNKEFFAINRNGKGAVYHECGSDSSFACQDSDKWFIEEVDFVNNVMYAGGNTLLMNGKLYFSDIITNRKSLSSMETHVIMDNVNKVWVWDNFKTNEYLVAQVSGDSLYMIDVNSSSNFIKYKINFDDRVSDVYFVDAVINGRLVLVGDNSVSLVVNGFNEKYERYIIVKEMEEVKSYINYIKGFYSEDNKLFALFSDGNVYLVKEFLVAKN